MTKLLAIETSSEACSVALNLDGESRELHEHAPMRHAELLLPAVSRLLDEAGLPIAALDAIAFGRGPGSFTSLRIGIGVVQGLAWAADLPVVPCSSLAAVAQAAIDRAGAGSARVCVALDARMQEVFTAEFVCGPGGLAEAASAERVCAPSAVGHLTTVPFVAAGNGFDRFAELKDMADAAVACYPDLWPHATAIARLALAWLEHHQALPPALAQPVYIRNNVAVKPASD
jgi:tRNA threonylcarbamoyladenosine biosynthesis protein TsaB